MTSEHEQWVDEILAREQVEIERTPIGGAVQAPPRISQEGDTIIIPIVDEVLVVEHSRKKSGCGACAATKPIGYG